MMHVAILGEDRFLQATENPTHTYTQTHTHTHTKLPTGQHVTRVVVFTSRARLGEHKSDPRKALEFSLVPIP